LDSSLLEAGLDGITIVKLIHMPAYEIFAKFYETRQREIARGRRSICGN
jgi:hypothetical protein